MADSLATLKKNFLTAHNAGDKELAQSLKTQLDVKKAEGPEAWYQDFGEGVGSSVIDTFYGIKDIFTDLSDEEKATVEDWRADASESGWGTAGRVAGEIGQLALPGGAALKGVRATGKGLNLAKALNNPAADIGLGALHAAATLPQEGESRFDNALLAAGGGVAGVGLAKTLGTLATGIKKSTQGQRMLDRGVPATPGKVSEHSLPQGLETAMSVLPVTAKGTKILREGAEESWNKISFNDVAPGGVDITLSGQAGMKQLKNAFNKAYDEAWDGVGRPSNEGFVGLIDQATDAGSQLPGNAEYVMRKLLKDTKKLSADFSPKGLKELDNQLRKKIEAAYDAKEVPLGEALKGMRETLRNSLDPEAMQKLRGVDQKYSNYLPLKYTAENAPALAREGAFSPKDLISGIKKAGDGRQAYGSAPGQGNLNQAMATLGRPEKSPLIDMMKAISTNISSPVGVMEAAGKGLLGETKPQKALAEGLDRALDTKGGAIAQYLRDYGISPARAGVVGANTYGSE